VTGDRIQLGFTINGAQMGSIIKASRQQEIRADVRGSDALDRIEVLRNGRVLATHCHQGAWDLPRPGVRSRFKLRLEVGWGPRPNEIHLSDRHWQGKLSLSDGRFLNHEPCWISPDQAIPKLDGKQASFAMRSATQDCLKPRQNAVVLEFEAKPETELVIRLNGLKETGTVHSFASGSRVMWFREECVGMLHEHCGLVPDSHEREDPYYNMQVIKPTLLSKTMNR
jgi:hypothetical protein